MAVASLGSNLINKHSSRCLASHRNLLNVLLLSSNRDHLPPPPPPPIVGQICILFTSSYGAGCLRALPAARLEYLNHCQLAAAAKVKTGIQFSLHHCW